MRRDDNTAHLLGMLFAESEGERYLDMVNSVGQRYLIPAGYVRAGLSLYRPSRTKGKLVKTLLPLLKHAPCLLAKAGIQQVSLRPQPALQALLAETFGQREPVLAVFCGTPGPHRKITIQVSHSGKILGYCKVSDNEHIRAMFARESQTLTRLHSSGISQTPRSLICEEVIPGIGVFIQSTDRKDKPLRYGKDTQMLWDFLAKLHSKTMSDTQFEQSDYYRTLLSLRASLTEYAPAEATMLGHTINEVEAYFAATPTAFSLYHGDLTPWNCFVSRGKPFVFDWEYSQENYPPFMDFFHFFTQSAFYEWRWGSAKTCTEFLRIASSVKRYVPEPTIYYKAYLLAVIQFYSDRDREAQDPAARQFRLGLLAALSDDKQTSKRS